jgi:CubicO group peptidase (beta-lactamase class C family)
MTDLSKALESWPALAAAGWLTAEHDQVAGPADTAFPWASVTKVLTAMAIWVAQEEGTVAWDDPVGPPGATLADLLAHASGLAVDDDSVLAPPERRRIYSNRGFEIAADHLARQAGMNFWEYLRAGVTEPLALVATRLEGSPASGASGSLHDLLAVGRELLEPSLISRPTLDLVRSVAFPNLAGVLPGFGHQETNDWGLGVEVRDHKSPHWTGTRNSPDTFGHFGRSGSFLWVDPERGLVLAALADRPFGPWAAEAWPRLSDQVITAWEQLSGAAPGGAPIRTPRSWPAP